MSEKLIEELKTENLCTHFILPLLKLNKFSFPSSNFVNSYLSVTPVIVVQIIEPTFLSRRVLLLIEYKGIYKNATGNFYLVYEIPKLWWDDLELFKAGKFSKMSFNAKATIIRWSNLAYRVMEQGVPVTDGRLMALNKEKPLQEMWERVINPWEHINGELLSIPGETSFIDLNTLTRIQEPGG